MAFTSSIDDVWITGGIVSGEPESKHYLNRLFHTEAILQAVIASLPGIGNVGFGKLPAFDTLAAAGLRDLQELAAERWGFQLSMLSASRSTQFCTYFGHCSASGGLA
jgi:hypothetical protein